MKQEVCICLSKVCCHKIKLYISPAHSTIDLEQVKTTHFIINEFNELIAFI